MNPLPAIELIGFLNWIDINRISFPGNQTIEEFFLDKNNTEIANDLASQYLSQNPSKSYPDTPNGRFESYVDTLLSRIKVQCITSFSSNHNLCLTRWDYERFFKYDFERIVHNCLSNGTDFLYTYHEPVTPGYMVDSIRKTLDYESDSEFEQYLSSIDGSSVKAVKEFLSFFKHRVSITPRNGNIPINIIKQYIREYAEDSFFKHYLSEAQMTSLQKTLERAFFCNPDSSYFQRITNLQSLSSRYWERTTRYKCLFLSIGTEFYELIEKNWEILHEYSGDHLDIFYSPDELLVKGYVTADKLNIRKLVNQYPCIFLWHTSLMEGKAIPVHDLNSDDLLSIVKLIVDDITNNLSFDDIYQNSLYNTCLMRELLLADATLEENLLKNLYIACTQLQANPSVFGDATENQRNTQIRDLLSNLLQAPLIIGSHSYEYSIHDQTLHGLSRSKKSSGEIDLLIKLEKYPYAIIEALNLDSNKRGTHWNRTYLDEHIQRLGHYDQNGIARNIILVYAKSDDFSSFYDSFINSINTSSSHYCINGKRIYALKDISEKYGTISNIRVVSTKYEYNAMERTLFFFIVRMESAVNT